MHEFFRGEVGTLAPDPNGLAWFQSPPLPGGRRVDGATADKLIEHKRWEALGLGPDGFAGKRVLDLGANDGFYAVAAALAGSERVLAVDSPDCLPSRFPYNLDFLAGAWGVGHRVLTAREDILGLDLPPGSFDAVFCLGVLYHVENPFGLLKRLRRWVSPGGVVYLETQLSRLDTALPAFEYASDTHGTVATQGRDALGLVGISNHLFPNDPAVRHLADSYGFRCERLGRGGRFERDHPTRGVYRLEPSGG